MSIGAAVAEQACGRHWFDRITNTCYECCVPAAREAPADIEAAAKICLAGLNEGD